MISMGSFGGHAVPGAFFFLYGFYWASCILKRYHDCRRQKRPYVSSATFQFPLCNKNGCCKKVPFEPALKCFCSISGILLEILVHIGLPVLPMNVVQHATMYFFFLMSGILDFCNFYGAVMPPGADYIALAVALTVEGLLFANHVHGREELDVHIHMLLVYVITLTVIVIVLEAKFKRSALLSLARASLLMLQGTWFWAVGIILYTHGDPNTAWKLDDGMSIMLATIYFSWHCASILVLIFIMNFIFVCWSRGKNESMMIDDLSTSERGDSQAAILKSQYGILSLVDDDSEEDFEFERT